MPKKPVVLITGAGRGIGAAAAGLAAARGFDVAVNYKSDEKSAADVVAKIKAHGGAGLAIKGDMGVEAEVERVFKTVDAELGPLTHLVYNCGITGQASRLADARERRATSSRTGSAPSAGSRTPSHPLHRPLACSRRSTGTGPAHRVARGPAGRSPTS